MLAPRSTGTFAHLASVPNSFTCVSCAGCPVTPPHPSHVFTCRGDFLPHSLVRPPVLSPWSPWEAEGEERQSCQVQFSDPSTVGGHPAAHFLLDSAHPQDARSLFPLVGTYREILPSGQWLGMSYMNANIREPIVTTYINDVL